MLRALWNVDFGLAKQFDVATNKRVNFEILFINAFNHRNTTVGGTGGADDQHHVGYVRSDDRHGAQPEEYPVAAAVQLVRKSIG